MDGAVWLHFCDEVGEGRANRVRDALAAAGLGARFLAEESPRGAGALLFSDRAEPACAALQDWRRADVQVLAVQIGAAPLDGDQYWQLLGAGAVDVLHWPDDVDGDASNAAAAVARLRRWRQIESTLESPLVANNLVGRSRVWRRALWRIVDMARTPEAAALILGESGTGKELAARLIHTLDARKDKSELIVVDCTILNPELSGSELFGHERGAFTGAVGSREGAIALAHRGTLFLDEIGELPMSMQAQLLRVLQERKYKRVGGNSWCDSNFRLICATNRNLEEEVALGHFRADLYYRIAHWVCRLPPLRERCEDIPLLVDRFLRDIYAGCEPPALQPAVFHYLCGRPYRGNVRELRQLVTRIAGRGESRSPITVGDIPVEERPDRYAGQEFVDDEFERAIRRELLRGVGLKQLGSQAADVAIRIAVSEAGGNLQRAARRLGVTDRALQLRRSASRQ